MEGKRHRKRRESPKMRQREDCTHRGERETGQRRRECQKSKVGTLDMQEWEGRKWERQMAV